MAIDFPNSPSVNQVFTSGSKSWIWNGTSWAGNNNAGFVGSQGYTGSLGYTGSAANLTAGDYVVRGYLNADQTITNGSDTVIQFIDDFDPRNWLSSYQFKPTVAGYYIFSASIRWGIFTATAANITLRKNGASIAYGGSGISSSFVYATTTGMVYMNGTTDYLELWGNITGTSPIFNYNDNTSSSYFSGYLARSA